MDAHLWTRAGHYDPFPHLKRAAECKSDALEHETSEQIYMALAQQALTKRSCRETAMEVPHIPPLWPHPVGDIWRSRGSHCLLPHYTACHALPEAI